MEVVGDNDVYLSLGSNQGDRIQNLSAAIELIEETIGTVLSVSSYYQTPPLGFEAEMEFLNCCLHIKTTLDPESLLKATQHIEHLLGRQQTREEGYSSRPIDIDTLLYSTYIYNSIDLIIPHPQFRDRKFVLVPLCELDQCLVDPITNLTMKQLLVNCKDTSEIKIYGEIKN